MRVKNKISPTLYPASIPLPTTTQTAQSQNWGFSNLTFPKVTIVLLFKKIIIY